MVVGNLYIVFHIDHYMAIAQEKNEYNEAL